MSGYRNEFNEARKNGNWTKAEKLIGELINVAGVEDAEFEEQQRKAGEEIAERMNKNDELARNLGKKI